MKKRVLSVMLTLIMVFALLPATALADDTPNYTMDFSGTEPVDWHNGSRINYSETDDSDTGWSWDYSKKTLTLKGLNFTTGSAIALKLPDGATIEVLGTNVFTSTYSATGSSTSAGIYAMGDLTITGSGSLSATGGTVQSSYGIYIGKMDANAILSGSVKVYGNGGAASSFSNGMNSSGSVTVKDNASLIVTGSTGGQSFGLLGKVLAVSGGTVTAKGGTAGS